MSHVARHGRDSRFPLLVHSRRCVVLGCTSVVVFGAFIALLCGISAVLQGCGGGGGGDATTTTAAVVTTTTITTTAARVISLTEYCSPVSKHCFTPSNITCQTPAGVDTGACDNNKQYPTCCPLTKVCVTVGATCAPPSADCNVQEYCSPTIGSCVAPSPTTCDPSDEHACWGNKEFPTCSTLTKFCVKVGANCTSSCYASTMQGDIIS